MKDAFSDLRTWGGPQAMNKNRKTSMSGESCAKPSGAPVKNGSTPRSPFRCAQVLHRRSSTAHEACAA